MKFWQAIFARQSAPRCRRTIAPLDFRRCARILFTQAILQPSGLFVLPLAFPVLPFPWAYAFYQNVTSLDDGDEGGDAMIKKSWRQATLWPRQNHIILAIMLAFAFCVFFNWATVCLTLPQLGKMLFGIESGFTKSPFAMLNTTFFAAMCGLTYLCVDPILKTVFALRCFYGESLQSGEDLKAELKTFLNTAVKTSGAILFCLRFYFRSSHFGRSNQLFCRAGYRPRYISDRPRPRHKPDHS